MSKRGLGLVLALSLSLGGCIFNQDGTPSNVDASPAEGGSDTPLDVPVDVERDVSEAAVETSPDMAPDVAVDPECVGAPSGAVCRFGAAGDAAVVGQTGSCQSGKFVRARFCFADAPCLSADGVCSTSACVPCTADSACAGGVCTALFISNQGVRQCCVGSSDNGVGTFTTSCSKGDNCKSGLCTSAGHCYTACGSNADCPGGSCGGTSLIIGGGSYTQLGCKPSSSDGPVSDSTLDSSVDSSDTSVDSTVDGGAADTTVDSGPDAASDTGSAG
ncbi:MAG: hypothetical protein KC503_44655 [Myxococcales bacterium]|nr:hypothetical protein [Myxococcales bacterium]